MDGASGTWLAAPADRASDAPAVLKRCRPPAGSRPHRLTAVSCVSSCGDVERQSAGRIRNFSTRARAREVSARLLERARYINKNARLLSGRILTDLHRVARDRVRP